MNEKGGFLFGDSFFRGLLLSPLLLVETNRMVIGEKIEVSLLLIDVRMRMTNLRQR